MKIDFGGIAKGYTSSRIMQIYKKCGVTSGLVSLGGNVQLLGAKPDGSAWKVAVESPDEDGNYLGILQAKDKAVITSGGYERYFEKNGKNYHHIIDPSTGYPAENGLTSVTIVSDDGHFRMDYLLHFLSWEKRKRRNSGRSITINLM